MATGSRGPPTPMTFGQAMQLTANLIAATARPWMLFCTRFGTAGRRVGLGGPAALWGIGILLAWAAFGHSPWLTVVGLPLAILAEGIHKAWPAGRGQHSRYWGDSALVKPGGNQVRGRHLEALVAIVCGLAVWPEDNGAGTYLVAAGVAEVLTLQLQAARQRRTDADALDGEIEAMERARRLYSDDPD